MARTITQGLSEIVEQLELERPQLVTTADIERMAASAGAATPARILALRLREGGWLLPTCQRGVWEFAPAELAGAFSSGDPLIPVKAFELAHPESAPMLTFQTAAWALGLADRAPSVADVAFALMPKVKIPDEISASTFAPNLPVLEAKGARSLAPESIVVHMAMRPSAVRSWASAREWLPDVAYECAAEGMLLELKGRAPSVFARAGYLLQGMRPDIAREIHAVQPPRSKVRFGAGPAKRCDENWQMVDALLPFDPRNMEALV